VSGTVIPITTTTDTPGKPIRLRNGSQVYWLAITPDGKTLYALTLAGSTETFSVTPISTATNTPGTPVPAGAANGTPAALIGAGQIAITPDGKTAYAANASRVTPINTATNTPGNPIHITGLGQIAITPDGRTVYAANNSGTITPINTATNTPGTPIHVGGTFTQAIAITP
jgi:hypothetical protein